MRKLFTATIVLASALALVACGTYSPPAAPPPLPAPLPTASPPLPPPGGAPGDPVPPGGGSPTIVGSTGQPAGFIPSVFFDRDATSPCALGNQTPLGATASSEAGHTCLQIFFGTNRGLGRTVPARIDDQAAYPRDPVNFFLDEPSALVPSGRPFLRQRAATETHAADETYAHGRVFVTVPKRQPGDRVRGFDPRETSLGARTPTDADRQKLFTTHGYELLNEVKFWNLAQAMKAKSELGGENWRNDAGAALVFVHGYNVSFSAAAYSTAQLAYDLKFAGVPMFFSWPANSDGNILSYFNDTADGAASVGDLKLFLKDVKLRLKPTKYILIAHSHGNQIVLNALNELAAEEPTLRNMFDAIVFASPDVDAVEFQRIAARVRPLAKTATLYASSDDAANSLRTILTRLRIPFAQPRLEPKPRAGFVPAGGKPVTAAGVASIDVTRACIGALGPDQASSDDADRVRHAKYIDAPDIASDLRGLLDGLAQGPLAPPHLRNPKMRPQPSAAAPAYWRFEGQRGC